MARKRDWLIIFIVLLLVSSIVGHYVGDVVVEADVASLADSAETHPLHSSGLASPTLNIPEPTTDFGIVAPQTIVVQAYLQRPLLRPPIV